MGHEPDSHEFSTLGRWVAMRASGMKTNIYPCGVQIKKLIRDRASNSIMCILFHGLFLFF